MSLSETPPPSGAMRVEGLRDGMFVAGGERRDTAFLIWSEGVELVPVHRVEEVQAAHFDRLSSFDRPPEVVLIGTGERMRWPDMSVMASLRKKGWGPEAMDSRAAARTYDYLLTEARQVAALILPL